MSVAALYDGTEVAEHRIEQLSAPIRDFITTHVETPFREHEAKRSAAWKAVRDQTEKCNDIAGRLGTAQRDHDRFPRSAEHGEEVEKFQAQYNRERDKLKKLTTRHRSLAAGPYQFDKIIEFFGGQRGAGIWQEIERPETRIKKGEAADAALARVQADRRDLIEQLQAIDTTPLTVEEGLRAAINEIKSRALEGRPNVRRTLCVINDEQGEIQWPHQYSREHGRHVINATAVLFWANQDALIEMVKREFAGFNNDGALSLEERKVRRAELRNAIASLEIQESCLVREILESGGNATFRHDMHPANVLLIKRVGFRERINHFEENSYDVQEAPAFSHRVNF